MQRTIPRVGSSKSGLTDPDRGHSQGRRRTGFPSALGSSLTLLALLVVPSLLTPWASAPTRDLENPLGALADRYRELAVYRDEGKVEITRFADGDQTTERLLFTTRLTPAGFQMELWPDSGGQTVLWTRAGRLFRYDARVHQFAPVASLADGLPGSVDPAAREALLVPRWLLGETPEPWPASARPAVETGQPCGDRAGDGPRPDGGAEETCRLLTFTAASAEGSPEHRMRLLIGESDGLVRRVEVERSGLEAEPSEAGGVARAASWIRVEVTHTVQTARAKGEATAAGEGKTVAEEPFVPPPEARPVEQIAEAPEGGPLIFSEGIQVFELAIPVRVVGRDGQLVTGLGADDFVVRVGDAEVPVEAVTWIDPVDPELRKVREMSEQQRRELGLESFVPGRLVVLFFQADFNAVRIKGHMSFRHDLPELLDAFTPQDRLAVVAFDSHLKLWQDFTTDHKAVLEAAEDAYRFGARPGSPRKGNVPESLAEHFDFAAAKHTAFVEQGLAQVAHALQAFNGQRVIVFLGWGVGHNNPEATREAYNALFAAGVTLHALDITYADAHDLAFPLAGMARSTGGVYAATHRFPDSAVQAVTVALSGHYELSLDGSRLPPDGGHVHVELREGLRGRIQTPDFEIRPADSEE
jgi:hypothetical protein